MSSGASSDEYSTPPPCEFPSVRIQSPHSPRNGRLSATNAAAPTHHDRCRIPKRANGARLGLISTNGAAKRDDPTTASAIAAIDHITGLPVQVFRIVVGFDAQRAISGQTSGRGWSRQTTQAVRPSGIAHQRSEEHTSE